MVFTKKIIEKEIGGCSDHSKCDNLCKNKHMDEASIKFLTVDKITKQTDDEYVLRFNVPINHDPGQFMQVSLFGIGEAPISICSYSKDYFEMSVRSVGNVSSHICRLKKGQKVGIRGPYGRGYHMHQFKGDNVIIVGGGCGVAPVRGIIEYIIKNRSDFKNVDIFFGFRNNTLMLFQEDYKNWKKHNMTVDVVLSEQSKEPNTKHGLITDILEADATKSNKQKIVFVCGPPPMIKAVCDSLLSKGFNKDQIYISEERQMKCAVGRCGHCMIQDKYCCTDGPVFRYDELEGYGE